MTPPPDHPLPNDHQFEVASAYLDGELDHDARLAARANPVVMGLVADLQALQEAVDDVPAPAAATRARAIAAAMAEFPNATGAAAPTSGGAPRPRWVRPLTLAAAAVAVVAAGAVVVQSRGGSDGDHATDAAAVTDASGLESSAERTSTSAYEMAPEMANDAAAPAGGDDAGDADATAPMAAPDAAASTVAAAGDVTTEDAAGAEPIPVITDVDTVAASPSELAGLGVFLADQAGAGALPPSPNTSCSFADAARASAAALSDEAVSRADAVEILADGRYSFDGAVRDVLVAVDRDTLRTFALDPDTCVVLVESPAP